MAAFVKNKLKAARDFLSKKDYAAAKDAVENVLSFEPDNYNANVFLGLANLELGNSAACEQAYRHATSVAPDQLLAWQGLAKFYERVEKWDEYTEVLNTQLSLYVKMEDSQKTAEVLQRLIDLQREHGTPQQLVEVLKLVLPSSPYYGLLSSLPDGDPSAPTATSTYNLQRSVHHSLPILEEIVEILEKQEQSFVTNEINKRRTRLNAGPPEQIKRDVGLEVWSISQLPGLYSEVLAHPDASDSVRRAAESKLLRFRLQYLQALGAADKPLEDRAALSTEVMDMINGIVLLNIPDELAWSLYFDSRNVLAIDEYDWRTLRAFLELFPDTALSRQLRAFMKFNGIALDEDEDESEPEKVQDANDADEETLIEEIIDAFEQGTPTVLSSRLLADVNFRLKDHANSIKIAQAGIEQVIRTESNLTIKLDLPRRAFNIILATGLVHDFAPKHHTRAIPILDRVLSQDPDNVACLLASGYVSQAAGQWSNAQQRFDRAAELTNGDDDLHLEASEEAGWCLVLLKKFAEAEQRLRGVLDAVKDMEERDEQKARLSWRVGRCLWDAEQLQESYALYIAALKYSSTFAPAFTSLGLYYLQSANPPDTARASKCFQKAFELDAREASAARYLAEGFADEQEWDLVEIVARRTIEGESGQAADPVTAQTQKYLPINAWAWKALGIVELNRRNFTAAINSLQVALRADEKDAPSWTRLGEAYLLSGRHTAALKSFMHAKELDPSNWTIDYFVAWVKQDLTEYDEAIALYRAILEGHPDETGVTFALANALLLAGRKHRTTGFFDRAVDDVANSVSLSVTLLQGDLGFKLTVWKLLTDGLLALPMDNDQDTEAVVTALDGVQSLVSNSSGEVTDILPLGGPSATGVPLPLLLAAHVCQNRVNVLAEGDSVARAAAFHDLSMVMHRVSLTTATLEIKQKCKALRLATSKQAVKLDPTEDAHWTALGVASFGDNVDVAQHAFIRAIELDGTNANRWAYLGLLYLEHGDKELANQALFRAQLLDPDLSMAWGGQAMVALANGHMKDARSLMAQAVALPDVDPIFELQFASRELRAAKSTAHGPDQDRLLIVFSVADRLTQRQPQNVTAHYLLSLVCERLGLNDRAIEAISKSTEILEALYEQSEDADIERRFVIANVTMGRLRLANGEYQAAIQAFETAGSLLGEALDKDSHTLSTLVQFGGGLAKYQLGDLEGAVALMEAAVGNLPDDAHVLRGHTSLLLAQTLWSLGTDEARTAASGQLLECIAANSEDLAAIVTLASMGLVLLDDSLVEAALSETLALPLHRRFELDPRRDVAHIRAQHLLLLGETSKALAEVQRARHLEPNGPTARTALARLLVQTGSAAAAASILSANNVVTSDVESLRLAAVTNSQLENGPREASRRMAQRAIMREPWNKNNWRVLSALSTTQ